MCYEFLRPLEDKQYKTGKVNHDQKTKEMGQQAQAESDKYRLSEDKERNLIPNF